MVEKVRITLDRYQSADGTLHKSAKAAQLHEWLANPGVRVEPAAVRHEGVTYDLHGNLWGWHCGRCKQKAARPIDTMLRYYSIGCDHCLATNLFDFHKYDGVDGPSPVPSALAGEPAAV